MTCRTCRHARQDDASAALLCAESRTLRWWGRAKVAVQLAMDRCRGDWHAPGAAGGPRGYGGTNRAAAIDPTGRTQAAEALA
jgi:hypothetical protein